jgi:sporulation protein YhbH
MSIFKHHKTSADRSATDRSRHKEKIRKAIRDGVHNIVSDESIIGQDGKKKIRIPVRGIKEYRFVYGDNETNKKVGSAHDKNVSRGQKIGNSKKKKQGSGEGKPGNKPGEEMYEVEITLEELSSYLFDDLRLPDLEKKKMLNIVSDKFKRKGYRNYGIRPRLSKKETLKNKIRRKKSASRVSDSDIESTEDESFSFRQSDFKYKHIKKKKVKSSNAVIFFMMDTSGSMTKNKKFLARSFFFLLYHFIRNKYENTEIVFISHSSEAKEVSEDDFFKRMSSGGTVISSALEKCLEISSQRYHKDSWNIYAFHCSDGDNWPSDNEKSINLSLKLAELCQMYAYIQTSHGSVEYWSNGGILNDYNKIDHKGFKTALLEKKIDVWREFKRIMGGSGGLES